MKKFKLMATCAAGIEALVGRELRDLGYETQVENGRVRFEGSIEDIIKTNLWLRTADRIEIIVGEFNAKTFEDLFQNIKQLPWDKLLPMDAQFPMNGRSHNSTLHSVPDVQSIAKKAVVNKLSETYHRRTKLPETGAFYSLETRINKNHVIVTLDTTGESLFKRGYRVAKGPAPLKENMAAALILLTNWYPDMPFLDPMCGSGTIPIEAALMARNIAPGFNRDFSCEKWEWVDNDMVNKIRDEADSKADYDKKIDIMASDVDGNLIDAAKVNAQEVGLLHDIQFKQLAVQDFKTDKINGVVVSNPPYGERLSDKANVIKLYKDLGKVFRPMDSWSKYFLTSDLEFDKSYGQKATKTRKLYNGSLRTDYFQFWGHKIRK
ncbi:THUMP domain-containing class I SAM-dependent RNA methyltransferase [Apilactobacillus quenuiae]|uniref:THUMP domain-containing class I SAM-dependent RNA methyltransferase n=1 Tax=Apilactobacillus quenuiae TaxID=2008377 RepID=UPI000D01B526|nr:class I SAM-dependent RNA methyltransferase [Apilactobacillus quenuiae]